ncbi:uncharacterized protein LOC119977851 [Scyliorhinus canicula]|uniref:uncharacterized protein LOC119977851 n=1 Tax=Scyliorhinus canicula TaxID=7830 RepID=UPI0018F67678|nr:uncharacterized protein LOC119977851 [Scyliorhinus canicula]
MVTRDALTALDTVKGERSKMAHSEIKSEIAVARISELLNKLVTDIIVPLLEKPAPETLSESFQALKVVSVVDSLILEATLPEDELEELMTISLCSSTDHTYIFEQDQDDPMPGSTGPEIVCIVISSDEKPLTIAPASQEETAPVVFDVTSNQVTESEALQPPTENPAHYLGELTFNMNRTPDNRLCCLPLSQRQQKELWPHQTCQLLELQIPCLTTDSFYLPSPDMRSLSRMTEPSTMSHPPLRRNIPVDF